MARLAMAIPAAALLVAGAAHGEPVTRIAVPPARAGWFVCDAVSGPYAAFAGAVTGGRSVISLLDRRSGRLDTRTYDVGAADHGAGSVFWPLSLGGRAVGAVRGINPGMVAGSDGIAPIRELRIGARALDCRWLGHLRFIGVDARRGVAVTQEGGRPVYRSFDFRARGPAREMAEGQRSNVPTLEIAGGREQGGALRFANHGFSYVLEPGRGGAGVLTVTKAGRIVARDRFLGSGWMPPARAAGGASAVWSGQGLDSCRRAPADQACLVAAMRRGGASAAAIAFTRALAAKGEQGYVSGWRTAGPVGIATVTYPFRANTNEGAALVPSAGPPILVHAYRLTPADRARADYRALLRRQPDAWPVAPGAVSATKGARGGPVVLHVRTRMATCHACAAVGTIIVAYRFDARGRFVSGAVTGVEG